MTFSELGLSAPILALAKAQGYESPRPIQAAAIPVILAGKDVLGIAQTGSGKTASFALPILQLFQQKPPAKNRHITALVLVPTRELAMQVGEVFQLFSERLPRPVKCLSVFGGVSINPQMIQMQGVEILVATPGRLLALVESKAMSLSEVDVLVLDEADKMLNMGFRDEMNSIFRLLPEKRQNLLFSATLGKEVNTITEMLLHDPIKIEIAQEVENLDLIHQTGYFVTEARKGPLLRYLIKSQNMQQVLVFTSSIHKADLVAHKLKKNGIQALALHSEKSQGARTEALRYLKSGEINVLVATDLASRGIDIPALPFVINYELPRSPKDFIHRIGRTGRAGVEGRAITFVEKAEEPHFYVIQKKMKKRVEMVETDEFDLQGY
ncbi:MAG: DEAD/DEAH box helicase [Saprospiraceae bacterium]|nr:DEAD/DEAH box helicase [Saprospiraceae bacterium]MCF8250989.1 DEAD/DEAH box helicase [Saprospiraceae bacterium]MCF8280318.1 DEAD/DEAH box helicase [Bacteroidales bacterium]MCF8312845.1 DEAD/DEAH box helicase [Saprospiraceae bacterium]MCF8441292.1 DEAD/DEAH box helicase [Saprospiraceae bacterium]